MAFPQISDADTKNGTVASNSTSWTITYPTNIAAGDLLLLFIASDGDPAFSASGFTLLAASELAACSIWLLGKVAAGTETGTFIATAGASEQGGWRMFRIPAAGWFGGALNSGAGGANDSNGLSVRGDTGASGTPDPPANDPANWATEDVLWIAAIAIDTSRTISVFPLAGRNTSDVSGGAGGATLGLCTTTSTVSSLDPGTFTISASDDWGALTVAIRPAAGGSGLTQSPTDSINNLADARGLGYGNLHADSMANLADAAQITIGYPLTLSDNANNLADGEVHVIGVAKVLAETLATYADAYAQLLVYLLQLTDSQAANWADAHQLLLAQFLALADTFVLTDTALITLGQRAGFSDTFTLSDVVAVVLDYQTAHSDSLATLADTCTQQLNQLFNFSDSLTLTDSTSLGYGLLTTDDADNLTDAYDQQLEEVTSALELTLSDAVVLSDALTVGYGLIADDAISLTDAHRETLGQLVELTDAVPALADSVALLIGQLVAFVDSLNLSDEQSAIVGQWQLFSDSVDMLADVQIVQLGQQLNLNDSVDSLVDALIQVVAELLIFADTLLVTDTATLGYGLDLADDSNLLIDAITTSAPQGPLRQVGVTDALATLNDEIALRLDYLLAIADAVSLTDAVILVEGLRTSLTDSLLLTDATTLTLGYHQPLADFLVLGDAIQVGTGYELAVSDVVVLSDAVVLRLDYLQVVNDTIALTDSVVPVQGHQLTSADTFVLSDAEVATLGHLVQLADTLVLADTIQLWVGYELAVTDTVALADAIALNYNYHLPLTDNASLLADSVAITRGLTAIIADNGAIFTEALNLFSAESLQLADTIALTDSLARFSEVFLPLTDSLALTDNVAIELRGPDFTIDLADTLQLTDAVVIFLGDELRLQLLLTDLITLTDHYFDLRHPYTPSAKRHIVVPSRARTTVPVRQGRVIVPASERTTRVK